MVGVVSLSNLAQQHWWIHYSFSSSFYALRYGHTFLASHTRKKEFSLKLANYSPTLHSQTPYWVQIWILLSRYIVIPMLMFFTHSLFLLNSTLRTIHIHRTETRTFNRRSVLISLLCLIWNFVTNVSSSIPMRQTVWKKVYCDNFITSRCCIWQRWKLVFFLMERRNYAHNLQFVELLTCSI